MCGIFGRYSFNESRKDMTLLKKIEGTIRHRGPDASGIYNDEIVTLGNCRLSILDLSSLSDQPIYSADKKIIVVQNGEIYNYIELREDLEKFGYKFTTRGDTEVILNAYQHWGKDFVTHLNGMFSIAIFDKNRKTLFLYRDRLGVKPLYIFNNRERGDIWFASEIKALLPVINKATPNYDSLAQYLALNYIPSPYTAFEDILHIPPATCMEISKANGIIEKKYWDLNTLAPEIDMSAAEAKAGILALLDDATRIRMRSDASFGAFLSGGLDSSSVVGFMSLYKPNINTYSIGFDDMRFDETRYANIVAKRFGTYHQQRVLDSESIKYWERFIYHCDQPHGDVSFIPTDQVSNLASKDVKMVLTGDGGDELFAGYEKYMDFFTNGSCDNLSAHWPEEFSKKSGLLKGNLAGKLLKEPLLSFFNKEHNPYRQLTNAIYAADKQDPINQVLIAEVSTLLPGNNLVKPDRMAMANSLEVRSPYLDYRLAEFAFKIPGKYKLEGGQTKSILKDALVPLLGNDIVYRKKQMFTVPIGEWFRQSLVKYCQNVLFDGRLEARGLFHIDTLQTMFKQHLTGTQNFTREIRAIISLEIWFRLFVDQEICKQDIGN